MMNGPVPTEIGVQAKNALLYLHGESLELLDQHVLLLINKGVLTESEWDEVLMAWAERKRAKPADEARVASILRTARPLMPSSVAKPQDG